MYIYSLPTSSPRTRTFERVSFHGLNPQARRECGGPFAGGEKRDCVSVCDGRGAVIVIFGEGRECPRVCVCAVASSYGCEGFCAAERLKKVAPSWDLVDLDRNPGHGRQSLGRYLGKAEINLLMCCWSVNLSSTSDLPSSVIPTDGCSFAPHFMWTAPNTTRPASYVSMPIHLPRVAEACIWT
ncbi:hypothetical protein MPH_02332 [Macrophomina phaseolina MS6]|uniref:Uncharacterized protein n=1 Tax=Macrophomina phaseolina (strain MS6) TaxID=1126212 RepID=K2RD03_MACPH|nr:hypothetical protein MPH_02332 [Macrophomina phaseolina MS6]